MFSYLYNLKMFFCKKYLCYKNIIDKSICLFSVGMLFYLMSYMPYIAIVTTNYRHVNTTKHIEYWGGKIYRINEIDDYNV
jgi:hypothetical protein